MIKRIAALSLLALALGTGSAGAVGFGVGAYGGLTYPLLQDDTGQGSVFGARAPVTLAPMFVVEPFYSSTSSGDVDEEFGGVPYTRSGLDVTAFGANVLFPFGTGFRFYPFAGIGSYKLEREGSEEVTNTGYNFGLGFGISPGVPGVTIDIRGEMSAVVDGDTSRKWANATVGVTYNFFNLAAK